MKTTLKIAAVLLIAVLTLPALFGLLARPSFESLVDRIERRHVGVGEVAQKATQHGWFQTRRRVSVTIGDAALRRWLASFLDHPNADAPLLLDLDVALRHGPLPLAAAGDGALSPALGNTLLTWQVRQGETSVTLPLAVVVRSGPRQSHWTMTAAPHEYVTGQAGGARLQHSGARLDGVTTNDAATHDVSGALGDLTFALPGGRRVDAVGGRLDVSVSSGNALGELRFDALRGASGVATSAPLNVADVTLSGDFAVSDGRLNSSTDIRLGETRLGDTTRSGAAHARLNYAADAEATAMVAQFFGRLLAGSDIDDGPSLVGALAAKGVAVELPELLIETPDGPLTAQMNGELPAGDGDARDMLLRSAGTAKMAIPVTLLRKIMASSADIEASMQYALQSHLVRRQGQEYVSDWRLRDGSLRINGRPVPLPL